MPGYDFAGRGSVQWISAKNLNDQEDCCQALGVHPNTKYQSDSGPGIPEIMDLLRFTKAPEVDRDRLMRAQAVSFLIGGTDAHAKNYSIIYEPGGAFA